MVRWRAESDCGHYDEGRQRERAGRQFSFLWKVMPQATKPDEQRRHHDDA